MIYLFGCSFTRGSGLIPEPEIGRDIASIKTNKYQDMIWGEYLKDYYNCEILNFGEGGAGNAYIRDTVVKEMSKFKKGDTVIIGITNSTRLSFPLYNKVTRKEQFMHILPNVIEFFKDTIAKDESPHWNGSTIDRDYVDAVSNYYMEVISRYEVFLDKHNTQLIESLHSFLNSNGINCILWDRGLWRFCETITAWTGGSVVDKHWSPNGHRYFSFLIKEAIEKKVPFLGLEEYYTICNNARVKYKKQPYVDYTLSTI